MGALSLVARGVVDSCRLIRVLVSIISLSLTGYRRKDVLVCICLTHKAVLNETEVCIFGIKQDHCKYTFLFKFSKNGLL